MAAALDASFITKHNRQLAADAILQGFADGNVATVLSTAHTAGFNDKEVAQGMVGGIINGINR